MIPKPGIYNPAALRRMKRVRRTSSSDRHQRRPDHLGFALANPGTERGSAFAMGVWTQGLLEKRDLVYYVPYTGTGLRHHASTHLGLVMRFPYRASDISGIASGWATMADVSFLQTLRGFRLGAGVERAFGGAGDMVPRRLRMGLAYQTESGVTAAYEWQGAETRDRYDFHRAASQFGCGNSR